MKEQTSDMTFEDIQKAHLIAAFVVKKFGDTYLPLFQRMHQELIECQSKSDMKALALSVAELHTK